MVDGEKRVKLQWKAMGRPLKLIKGGGDREGEGRERKEREEEGRGRGEMEGGEETDRKK